ncbi:hypothetical protein ACFXPA_12200 [Amycolatopsis sp. NPDC059090]
MARYCESVLLDHAARHGWSSRLTNVVGQSLDVLQAFQATPGSMIKASDAASVLNQRGLTVESTLEVLAAAELLDDDRVPAIRAYFLVQTRELPAAMRAQLETWYAVMVEGTTVAPRRRPRDHRTVRAQLAGMLPCLRSWAEMGHSSLAEISREQVLDALPESGPSRLTAAQGLRSLFRILKSRKELFINPAAGVSPGIRGQSIPLPVDTQTIQDALNAPDPARALSVALVAFHGVTARQVSSILLTDVSDGILTIGRRAIPLAAPVRVRLAAYLDHRARQWPETTNPYLLVNRRSAPRDTPVDARYPWKKIPLAPRPLREDRILHEVFATGGDVRQICDLFGMSINAAMRYGSALDHPALSCDTPSGS